MWEDIENWNTWDHGIEFSHISHALSESAGKLQVTHQIEMKGPLAFLFAYLIGRTMKKNLPVEMRALVNKAESAR